MANTSQRTRQRLKKRAEKAQAAESLNRTEFPPDPRAPDETPAHVGVGGDSGRPTLPKYGHSGTIPFRTEARMEQRAIREGWIKPSQAQQFMTRISLEEVVRRISADADKVTILDVATLTVVSSLKSGDVRRSFIAVGTVLAMERANQSFRYHAEDLKIKQAIAEQKRGHNDDLIPCGVAGAARQVGQ